MAEYDRVTLSRADIESVRDEAFDAACRAGFNAFPKYDENRLFRNDVTTDMIDAIKEAVKKKEQQFHNNSELYIICEMALSYLDIVEQKKEEEQNDNQLS